MITLDLLQHLFDCDPIRGVFYWRNPPALHLRRKGHLVGNRRPNGRWRIRINGREYLRSHLMWLWVNGYMPELIDHKDRDCSNDSIHNLRTATQSQNLGNRSMMKNNTSGYRSVFWDSRKKRWRARLSYNGKRVSLGSYCTPEEAYSVVQKRGRELYGEFWSD